MKLTIIFLLFQFKLNLAVNYCELCPHKSHTMCKYEAPSEKCIMYKKFNLTQNMKNYIVDVHNDIRDYVASGKETVGKLGGQPSASNMMLIEWDEELALIAQRWADQCVDLNDEIQHDNCRKTERYDAVGQNILTNLIDNEKEILDLSYLILAWYQQVENVIPADINYFSEINRGKFKIGHYTQLVWASTRYVGCGVAFYKSSHRSEANLQRLVCNYAPAGNVIGKKVYEIGKPCDKCKCDQHRRNLCKSFDDIKDKMVVLDGTWYNGRCRCNIVYRSGAVTYRIFTLLSWIIISLKIL